VIGVIFGDSAGESQSIKLRADAFVDRALEPEHGPATR
jgi:hypothetical protein